jgi:hypothetical protein
MGVGAENLCHLGRCPAERGRSGRPATHRKVRSVVLRLARENESWATGGSTASLRGWASPWRRQDLRFGTLRELFARMGDLGALKEVGPQTLVHCWRVPFGPALARMVLR